MHTAKAYKQMLIYIEACESGSVRSRAKKHLPCTARVVRQHRVQGLAWISHAAISQMGENLPNDIDHDMYML